MAVKYFEFEDGQRLPGDRVKEFLMNQAVIQVDNPTELINSGVEAFGVKVLNAEGLFLTQDDKDELSGETEIAYQAALTAQGLALTADNKATGAVNTANLTAQGLTVTNQNVSGLDGRVTTAESNLTATNLTLTTTTNTANSASSRVNAITDISAGEIVVRKGPVVKAINGTTNETTIDGGTITTNSINVNRLVAGTLTGFTVNTKSSGTRVQLRSDDIEFYNSSGLAGSILGGSTLIINSTSGGSLQTGNVPRITWDSNSISLLQNTTQTGSLSASGTVSSNGGFDANGTTIGGSVSTKGGIQANGNLTIGGTANLNGTLDVASTANFGGGIFRTQLAGGGTTGASFNNSGALIRTSSSQRYKQDISNLEIDYQDILTLEPKKFRRIEEVEENENAKYYPGFIAEDLAGTNLDIFVFYSEDENGNLRPEGIHYPELTTALVSAIKAQDAKLSDLEARIAALEGGAQ